MHDARAICVYIVYIMYVSRVYIVYFVYFRVFCVCRRIPSCAAPSPVTSSHHVIAGVPDGSDTPTKALQISQMLLQYCISCIYCVYRTRPPRLPNNHKSLTRYCLKAFSAQIRLSLEIFSFPTINHTHTRWWFYGMYVSLGGEAMSMFSVIHKLPWVTFLISESEI